ncbi:hypothetical protein QCN29_14605 [Streptomyces sp. HNM0663]|uniref:Uncharacterized protein n=1 Tax=Streptomyces chengmaiensis TaxID=3040919 RepID=A0ABT6HMQ3_9ACTN|nr:hypothetical protein [Streptomyces chengmaiensis]MDH2390000.1 hypothetical protein [Streptomyces chengmaiensis]
MGRGGDRHPRIIDDIVGLPAGRRPHRVTVHPVDDGSGEVSNVAYRIRREFLTRVGLADLLTVHPGNN